MTIEGPTTFSIAIVLPSIVVTIQIVAGKNSGHRLSFASSVVVSGRRRSDDSTESVEDKVTKALERCLVNRARQMTKTKAAKVAKKVAKVKKPVARRAARAS